MVDIKKQLSGIDGLFRKQENQVELIVLLVLLVVVAIGYFYTWPTYQSYAAGNIQVKNLELQIESLENKKSQLIGLQDLITNSDSFVRSVKDILPTDQQVPEVLFTMEKLVNQNGLYMTDFTPRLREDQREVITDPQTGRTTVRVAKQYRTVQLDFNLTGHYEQVKSFVLDLQNNIRPIDVQSVSINGGGELQAGGERSPLRFSVTAYIYYQPE